MAENTKKPAIRFAGFTEAWEQRKLGEVANKVNEKNIGLQYIETFTNSAEFGIISQRDFFDHDIAKSGISRTKAIFPIVPIIPIRISFLSTFERLFISS